MPNPLQRSPEDRSWWGERRHELAAHDCELLALLKPPHHVTFRVCRNRQVINGMVYKIRAGISGV